MNQFFSVSLAAFVASCGAIPEQNHLTNLKSSISDSSIIIVDTGTTLNSRFNVPPGYKREPVDSNSFAFYLRHLPLKASGSGVMYYNGQIKAKQVHQAVVNIDIGQNNPQQCADAIMRLRGEYLFRQKRYEDISFTLTNGFTVDYSTWMQGFRIAEENNKTSWIKASAPSNAYNDFKKYMELVFTYAGTLSLSKTLRPQKMERLTIGDVFIVGGSPGHAVIVVDVAANESGEKIFMLAQSYMPAQDIHVLINAGDKAKSPWYHYPLGETLHTPEWTFNKTNLKTW